MMKRKTLLSIFLTVLCTVHTTVLLAAEPDFMRSLGKMYVVVGVIILIFIGIIFYLVRLDQKLTKIENQIKK